MIKDSALNIGNFSVMRAQPPQQFDYLRFDPNNDCNVHCVYCHNERSKQTVDKEEFSRFLHENVISVENFQFGCGMEPTLDRRMADLMLMVAKSPGRPRKRFTLQTNGILLHMHDHGKLREAGMTHISVSIDAADPVITKQLRGGTSLSKVLTNVTAFHKDCPGVDLGFITTVTKLNMDAMEQLVAVGLDLGVTTFVFREVFYYPDNHIVDHQKMPLIVLRGNDFARMRAAILAKFGDRAEFVFADEAYLDAADKEMKTGSTPDARTGLTV